MRCSATPSADFDDDVVSARPKCADAPGANSNSTTKPVTELAQRWWQQLDSSAPTASVTVNDIPPHATEVLAELAGQALNAGKTLLLLVPDDEFLPAFSSALDIGMRPLCLVLPSADFAARIAMRATLSLLKSRIARDGDDEQGNEWQEQRRRIKQHPALWQTAQEWNASNERVDWPEGIPELFPVRILPVAAFRAQPRLKADVTVFFCCDLGVDTLLAGGRQLFVGGRAESTHQHALAFVDETTRLAIELAQLTQDVGDLELELATAQGEIGEFTKRYYAQIGRRMTELDVLRAKVARVQLENMRRQSHAAACAADPSFSAKAPEHARAEAEYEQLNRQAERSREESRRFAEAEQQPDEPAEAKPFRPDAHIKKLFRQLAQRIHPDRATSEADRAWRTQLMSEANRAYRAGNAQALKEVASLWEEGAGNQAGLARAGTSASPQDMLRRQIATMRQRFEAIRAELHRLFGSRLYELFLAARQVRRAGRDLLQEMADRLDAQIDEAMATLGLTPPAASA